jgi:hypothetical protein
MAGLLTKAGDGHDNRLTAQETWLIVGILAVGYMIARGLAIAGGSFSRPRPGGDTVRHGSRRR